jgi:hypothetical protein
MLSGPWGIVVVRASWPGHPTIIKKKKKKNKQIHGNFISKKLIYVEKKQMETRIALLLSF